MLNDLIREKYDSSWRSLKIGKLWVSAKDLLENGKQPLLPDKSFYSDWDGTAKDLSIMAGKILKYLKFKSYYTLRVDFSGSIKHPGLFVIKNRDAKITIQKKYKNNSIACAAILAHEICHLIFTARGIKENDLHENERLTDFATAYFGLGILVLNGKSTYYKTGVLSLMLSFLGILALPFGITGLKINPLTKNMSSFGYWGEEDYYNLIFLGYVVRNDLDLDKFSPYIKKGMYTGF